MSGEWLSVLANTAFSNLLVNQDWCTNNPSFMLHFLTCSPIKCRSVFYLLVSELHMWLPEIYYLWFTALPNLSHYELYSPVTHVVGAALMIVIRRCDYNMWYIIFDSDWGLNASAKPFITAVQGGVPPFPAQPEDAAATHTHTCTEHWSTGTSYYRA